jgi:hypothetical protein
MRKHEVIEMNTEKNKLSKIKRAKEHIKENKAVYIGTAAGFAAGIIIGVFAFTRKPVKPEEMIESMKIHIQTLIKGGRRNTTNVYQTVSMYGNVIGRPGNPVRDLTTGKEYTSESLAATAVGIPLSSLSKHLNGRQDHANGHRFERIFSKD